MQGLGNGFSSLQGLGAGFSSLQGLGAGFSSLQGLGNFLLTGLTFSLTTFLAKLLTRREEVLFDAEHVFFLRTIFPCFF